MIRDARMCLVTALVTLAAVFVLGNRAGDALIAVGARLKQAGTPATIVDYSDELPVAVGAKVKR